MITLDALLLSTVPVCTGMDCWYATDASSKVGTEGPCQSFDWDLGFYAFGSAGTFGRYHGGWVYMEEECTGNYTDCNDTYHPPSKVEEGVTGYLIPTYVDSVALSRFGRALSHCETPRAEARLARNTVVDGTTLTRRLEHLVNSPESCLQMGRAGRKRAEELFSLSSCNAVMVSLWHSQLDRRAGGRAQKSMVIDWSSLFSHYGDCVLDFDEMRVHCQTLTFSAALKDPAYRDVTEVLRCAHLYPATIREICARSGAPRDLVILLLKKGLLEPCSDEHS